jgi:hypothetical protein
MTKKEIRDILDQLDAEVLRRHQKDKLPIDLRNQVLAAIDEIRDKLLRRIKSSSERCNG